MKTILSLSLTLAMALAVQAQDNVTSTKPAEEKPAYSVSFVAVGAQSDAFWVGDGDKMEVHAHDPGAAAPRVVYIDTPSSKGKRKQLTLALNVPTERVKLSSNVCNVTMRYQSGDDVSYKNFTSVQLPKKMDPYTVLMARQPKHRTWKSPQRMVLSDSKVKFPLGSVRVVNLSDRPVVVQRGKKLLGRLGPKKSVIIKKVLRLKNPETLMLLYEEKGKKRVGFQRQLKYPSDQRANIVCSYMPKRSRSLLSHLFLTKEPIKPPVTPKNRSGVAKSVGTQ